MKTLRQVSVSTVMIAGGLLCSLLAGAGETILIDKAPPAPRIERAPPHRDGYVWAPGYWEWTGRFFHWVSGTWVVEHRRSHWVADHWVSNASRWQYIPGHWEQPVRPYNARTP